MSDLTTRILHALGRPSYTPVKPKVLAKRMGVTDDDYPEFRKTLQALVHEGRIAVGQNQTAPRRPTRTAPSSAPSAAPSPGPGFVRPHAVDGDAAARTSSSARARRCDAATGDEVLVRITRKAGRIDGRRAAKSSACSARATRTFVGTYFERDGEGFVRVDGTVFAHSVYVGDPGAKGAKPQRQGRLRDAPLPDAGRPRRGRHHRGPRPARPAGRRHAVDHPARSACRTSSPTTRSTRPAPRPTSSARTTSTAATTSPATRHHHRPGRRPRLRRRHLA